MNHFSKLDISDWQQFRMIDIEFHDRLTVLTGANGSGKTTLLNLLGRHADWEVPSLAVPKLFKLEGIVRFVSRFLLKGNKQEDQIGTLWYEDGEKARLLVPQSSAAYYHITLENRQNVPCFFIPSHRSVYRYQQVTQIPVARLDKQQAFQRIWGSNRERYFGGISVPASYQMKEILVSWSILGRGNADMVPDGELLSFYEGFQDVLRKVLPPTLGFRRLAIRNVEIVLECDSGEFMIDAASGGMSTLIDLAWQIFMFSARDNSNFTVIIDEVENHLHPTMQRRVLSDLLSAFPQVRFIVSTHSPLIVTSVRDSIVFALRFDESRSVVSERLDVVNHARTATQILDEVLGVPSTIPIWAEIEIQSVVNRFASSEITESSFVQLRSDLAQLGLADFMPQALGKLLDARIK